MGNWAYFFFSSKIPSEVYWIWAKQGFWEDWNQSTPRRPYSLSKDVWTGISSGASINPLIKILLGELRGKKDHNLVILWSFWQHLLGPEPVLMQKPHCISAPVGTWQALVLPGLRPHAHVCSQAVLNFQVPLAIYPLPYSQPQTSLCLSVSLTFPQRLLQPHDMTPASLKTP